MDPPSIVFPSLVVPYCPCEIYFIGARSAVSLEFEKSGTLQSINHIFLGRWGWQAEATTGENGANGEYEERNLEPGVCHDNDKDSVKNLKMVLMRPLKILTMKLWRCWTRKQGPGWTQSSWPNLRRVNRQSRTNNFETWFHFSNSGWGNVVPDGPNRSTWRKDDRVRSQKSPGKVKNADHTSNSWTCFSFVPHSGWVLDKRQTKSSLIVDVPWTVMTMTTWKACNHPDILQAIVVTKQVAIQNAYTLPSWLMLVSVMTLFWSRCSHHL